VFLTKTSLEGLRTDPCLFSLPRSEKNKVRQLMWLSAGLLFFSLCLLGAMGGLMFSVIEMTKESKIGGSGVMTVKGSNTPVQTASSDMTVSNGVLSTRPGTEQTGRRWINGRRAGCQDDGTCALTTQSTQVSTARPLSSLIEDSYFEELKTLKIVQGDSWVQFSVLAVARYSEAGARFGSVVVIFTHIGELTLDGDAMFFHESIAGAFSRAGLKVDTNGRRLLGIVEIIGLFNLLESAFADSGLKDDEMPRMPGNQFRLEMVKVTYCDAATTEKRRQAGMPHGAGGCSLPLNIAGTEWRDVDWVSVYQNRKALVSHESLVSVMIDGIAYGKSIQSSEQWPGQNVVEIMNVTHKLVYQSYNDVAFHCKLEESNALASLQMGDDAMKGTPGSGARRLNDKDDKGTTVTFEGFVTIDDIYCRKFVITQDMKIKAGSGAALPGQEQPNPQMEVILYEDYSKRQVYRIEMYGSAWIIKDLESLHSPEDNPTSTEEFDMEAILEQCNREDIVRPEKITIGMLTDRVVPDDFVGKTYEVASAHFNSTWNTTSRRSETLEIQGSGFAGLSDDAYDSQGKLVDPEMYLAEFSKTFKSQVAQMKSMGKLMPGRRTKGARRGEPLACWSFLPLIPATLLDLFEKKFGATFDLVICDDGTLELVIESARRRRELDSAMMGINGLGGNVTMTAGDTGSGRALLAMDENGQELDTKENAQTRDGRRGGVCPETSGDFTIGADMVGKSFSVEGCFRANFPLLGCYAASMMPAAEPALEAMQAKADDFGMELQMPSLELSICGYLKAIGQESTDCLAKLGSQMELGYNPGMSASAVIGMGAKVTIPQVKTACRNECIRYKMCCKKWKTYTKTSCATICWPVPWLQEFNLASFEAGLSADFPLELRCANNRREGSNIRLGTSITASVAMSSDLIPVARMQASIQLYPWMSGNKCAVEGGAYTFKQDRGETFSYAMHDLGFGSCFK